MGNETLGGQAPNDPLTSLTRRVTDLERRVREQASVRSLQSTSIDKGGLTLNPVGPGIRFTVQRDAMYDPPLLAASMELFSRDPAAQPCTINMYDQGPGSVLYIRSNKGPTGYFGSVGLAAGGGVSLQAQNDSTIGCEMTLVGNPANGGPMISLHPGASDLWTWDNRSLGNLALSAYWVTAQSEWRAQDGYGGYIPVRASSFPTSSSRGVKDDVGPLSFDALTAIDKAPVYRWKYKTEQARDGQHHISPMADDLPAELVAGQDNDRTVDMRDMVGVLWEAARALYAKSNRRVATVGQAPTPATLAIGATRDVTVTLAQPMSDTDYDAAVTAPAGFDAAVKTKTKTTVVVTLKALVTIAAAGSLTVMATAR